jgi:hypothetical protein
MKIIKIKGCNECPFASVRITTKRGELNPPLVTCAITKTEAIYALGRVLDDCPLEDEL